MSGFHSGRTPGLGRSFMKGPRFFVKPSNQKCCEKCVYGTGKHSADCVLVTSGEAKREPSAPSVGKRQCGT